MNNRAAGKTLGAVLAVVVLVVLAGWGYLAWVSHQLASTKSELASGYNAHALASPFLLLSKSWQPQAGLFSTTGTWVYHYATVAGTSGPSALAAAKQQLGQGGYQVIAGTPDVISSTQAVLNRDLITGDDQISAQIDLTARPITAAVTITPLAGG